MPSSRHDCGVVGKPNVLAELKAEALARVISGSQCTTWHLHLASRSFDPFSFCDDLQESWKKQLKLRFIRSWWKIRQLRRILDATRTRLPATSIR
jgi:hypothetical protein